MNKQQPIKLKPCPFCGCRDVNAECFNESEGDLWVVECQNCYVQGPDAWSRTEACNRWNKRVAKAWSFKDDRR